MIGLYPPLDHDQVLAHFQYPENLGAKGRKRAGILSEGQWSTIHPDAHNRHGLDFGYGVAIQLKSGRKYNVEELSRDMRRGYPTPVEIVEEYPLLIQRLQDYNRKIQ